LGYSNDFTAIKSMALPVSGSLFASSWLNAMEEVSGSTPFRGSERSSISTSNPSSKPAARNLMLVLAEDNLPDALLVREAILMEGLPVDLHVVADGEQARDLFGKAAEDPNALHPDVLLLDLNLPRIDGLALLRGLREQGEWKALPVMIITSSDAPADRASAERLGASYFRKPLNYDAFLKVGQALKQFLEDQGLLKKIQN